MIAFGFEGSAAVRAGCARLEIRKVTIAVTVSFWLIIAAHDELEFDAHGKVPPGLRDGGMM